MWIQQKKKKKKSQKTYPMGSQKHIFGNLLKVIYWVTLPIGMDKNFTDLDHWSLKIIPYAQWEHADFWPLKLKVKYLLDSPDCTLEKSKGEPHRSSNI